MYILQKAGSESMNIIVLRYGEIHTTVTSIELSLFRKELYGYYLVQEGFDHTAPLFQRANVLKFTDLVKLKTAVFM